MFLFSYYNKFLISSALFFDIEFGFVDILHLVINLGYLDYVNFILFILFRIRSIGYWLFIWVYGIRLETLFSLVMCIIDVDLLIDMNFGPTMWVKLLDDLHI